MRANLAVVVVALACVPCEAQPPDGARGAAFEFAKKLLTPALKNPASATFEWESVQYIRTVRMPAKDGQDAADIVICEGVVRATNSFNAIVPSEWTVCMHHDGEVYTPILANLDKQVVFRTEMADRLASMILAAKEKKAAEASKQAAAAAAERQKQLRMSKAYEAGKKAGTETAEKMKLDKLRIPQSNVDRLKDAAVKDLEYSSADESAEFVRGFVEAVEAIRKK
jgi:hypothetical protein